MWHTQLKEIVTLAVTGCRVSASPEQDARLARLALDSKEEAALGLWLHSP